MTESDMTAPVEAQETVTESPEAREASLEAAALARFMEGRPGPEHRVLARSVSYNSKGYGAAEHRRCILPGQSTSQWVSDAGETEGNYDGRRGKGADYTMLPEGTVVVAYDTETNKFGKGRAKLTAGIVRGPLAEGKSPVGWGFTVRRKGDAVVVTLPNGHKLTF